MPIPLLPILILILEMPILLLCMAIVLLLMLILQKGAGRVPLCGLNLTKNGRALFFLSGLSVHIRYPANGLFALQPNTLEPWAV